MNTFVRKSAIGIITLSMLGGVVYAAEKDTAYSPQNSKKASTILKKAIESDAVNLIGQSDREKDISNKTGNEDTFDVSVANRKAKEIHDKNNIHKHTPVKTKAKTKAKMNDL